ncbi:MAG: hypothetical protein LBD35_04255 [Prevotellaceae bacterium]|jgi:hypothetical protein|nr:hypothetical protein [Prevotellaceae bacterium]
MASFNYTVDTAPMAHELGNVANQLKTTAAAVSAMKSAVILAEEKAADKVCDNVNRSFYTLIRSQISQKIAKLHSEVNSQLMQLTRQRKQLLTLKSRMERDYNMISGRYMKLFGGLNSNLKQRIFELDKPAADLALKEAEKLSNRMKYLAATVPVAQTESLSTSQKIVASNLKFRGMKAIVSITGFLSASNAQKILAEGITLSAGSKSDGARLFVPVAASECVLDASANKSIDVRFGGARLNRAVQSAIKDAVLTNVENLRWVAPPEIDSEIKAEFGAILAASPFSQRVKDTANKLFAANVHQIAQNNLP